ncbi:hypothetical protein RDI58_016692 [Solanum bulbocastanum]|uniref:Uncharacterized protein n=1 Tax=Solanum bulbocastanum TaxID=147425 RepID=A0AAN8TN77_SOLBU
MYLGYQSKQRVEIV